MIRPVTLNVDEIPQSKHTIAFDPAVVPADLVAEPTALVEIRVDMERKQHGLVVSDPVLQADGQPLQ